MTGAQNSNIGRNEPWRVELRENIKAKERSSIERVKMPEAEALTRIKSNVEVNSGITRQQAQQEAKRCLDCATPTCIDGCPVGIDIPGFIKHIEAGNMEEAVRTMKRTNTFPAVCGRVCPQEVQCEAKCTYVKIKKPPVAIGYLERYIADFEIESCSTFLPRIKPANNIKVAVVGSGPAGMAAASDLAKNGYDVTVFEALHDFGGVLRYGIPEFRLPNYIIDREVNLLKQMGVKFEKNFIVGKTASFDDLKEEGYRGFFVGSGAGLPNFMNIPGENYNGILSANEYLTRVNLMGANQPGYDTPVLKGTNVAVIGGGNTAMDSVRTSRRMGAKRAMIIYRRSLDEMPARKEEITHAIEEGVEIHTLTNPVEYLADSQGRVNRMIVQKMELGEPDSSGRRKPVAIAGSEYSIDVDLVIVSVGVSPNPIIAQSTPELKVSKWGTIEVDNATMKSNLPGIFAGGDIVRGGATVILAMGDGRKAAKAMDTYLKI